MFLKLLLVACTVAMAYDCSQPKDVGEVCTTGAATRKFFYDTRTKVCQPLQYLGCAGNDNRFDTQKDCKDACQKKSGPVTGGTSTIPTTPNNPPFVPSGNKHEQWRKAEICGSNYLIPNGRYILCTSSPCPSNHSCVNGACCPSKDYVCSLRDDNGNFQDPIEDRPRFAWSHEVHSCIRYSYYGANGNYNNFPNFQSCIKYCSDSKKIDV